MPRFFFHFKTPDDYFEDDIGSDLDDLAAVHSVAARLVSCVIRWTPLGNNPPDFRHWIVKVTDERQQPVLSMMFPLNSVPKSRNDAHTFNTIRSNWHRPRHAVKCRWRT